MNKKIKKLIARTGLFKTHLPYDDALKNIKQVYPWNGKIKEMLKSSQRKVENRFHLLSLTEDWNNISMWNSKDYCSNN